MARHTAVAVLLAFRDEKLGRVSVAGREAQEEYVLSGD